MRTAAELIDHTIKLTGVNVLKKIRKREHIELRSLLFTIMAKRYKMKHGKIERLFNDKGLSIDRTTILHSLKKTEIYLKYNEKLRSVYQELCQPTQKEQREVKICTKLETLVGSLPKDKEQEILELIMNRVKSWEWKSRVLNT